MESYGGNLHLWILLLAMVAAALSTRLLPINSLVTHLLLLYLLLRQEPSAAIAASTSWLPAVKLQWPWAWAVRL